MVNKFITRKAIKDKRIGLSPEAVTRLSTEIYRRLSALPEYISADTVCLYIGVNNEVDTAPIIAHAIHNGKRVAAPRVSGNEMEFYQFEDSGELTAGAFGIPEPTGDKRIRTEDALLIMPGVAFDEQCNRIGYGGGFYDRYLAGHKAAVKIALAYEIQLVEKLDAEAFDIKPDMIVTEKRVIKNPEYLI